MSKTPKDMQLFEVVKEFCLRCSGESERAVFWCPCDGKRHYGDGLYKKAAEITGQSSRTLEDYKRMSDQFDITLRNVELSYNHHKEVASLKQIVEDKKGKLHLSDEAEVAMSMTLPQAMKRGDVKAERNGKGQPRYVLANLANAIPNASIVRWRQLAEIPLHYQFSQRRTTNMDCVNPSVMRPMKAIRANCLECSGTAKAVAYCTCDGVNSTRCHLWPYRFGCRLETAREKFGEAMLTPRLMPGPNVELELLPKNPRDYRANTPEKAVEGNVRADSEQATVGVV